MRFKLFFLLFVISCHFSYAQTDSSISVLIRSGDTLTDGKSIKLSYYDYYSFNGNWPVTNETIGVVKEQLFTAYIKPKSKIGYLQIFLPEPYLEEVINTIFLVERGDHIIIDLKNGKVFFKGGYASKYSFQQEITDVQMKDVKYGGILDTTYYQLFFKACDEVENRRLSILEANKKNVSPFVYDIFRLNIKSENKLIKLVTLNNFAGSNDTFIRNATKSAYLYFQEHLDNPNFSDSAFLYSKTYFDLLLLKEISELLISSRAIDSGRYKFNELFGNIYKSYSGVVRDRLLLSCILGHISVRDSTEFYRDLTLATINDSYSRDILEHQRSKIGFGAKAFNFRLQDTAGRFFSLGDFQGKTIIMDYYFNGCSGCADLTLGMVKVFDRFKNNPNVVFISVNVDKSKDRFISAVRSGKYTHEGYINLYTNGEGVDNSLIQYYGLSGYPVLMVIDKNGNILDGNPPYPYNGRSELATGFIRIIDDALK